MDFRLEQCRSYGFVIDLSLRHNQQGIRYIDLLKKGMIQWIGTSLEEGIDTLYLYNVFSCEAAITIGQQVAAVANYNIDGWKFNVFEALWHTSLVVSLSDEDVERIVVLVTDKTNDPIVIERINRLIEKEGINCRLVVVGVDFDSEPLRTMVESRGGICTSTIDPDHFFSEEFRALCQ